MRHWRWVVTMGTVWLLAAGCSDSEYDPSDDAQASDTLYRDAGEDLADGCLDQPTMQTCRQWVRDNHSLDYVGHEHCAEYSDIFASIASQEGGIAGVIPVGNERFFIVWIPDEWEGLTNQKLIVGLPGSGGCAERNYQSWRDTMRGRPYALAYLQYHENNPNPGQKPLTDEVEVVYENLTSMLTDLRDHCPVADAHLVYFGFSQGSYYSFPLAVLDHSSEGIEAMDSFIADSGAWKDEPHPILGNASEGALIGTHFWFYCSEQDMLDDGRNRCETMDVAQDMITALGAIMDGFYRDPRGGHGIFSAYTQTTPLREPLLEMFDYIDSL